MTTTVRAKFRATTLEVGDLVRHSCSDTPPCPYDGRVGVVRSAARGWPLWTVDFGNGVEHCWLAELTPVRRST